jgi:hypothetical protein
LAADPPLRFNEILTVSINETIEGVLGKTVLKVLHEHLESVYNVSPEEIPYRIDTLESVSEKLGKPFKPIERTIARRFYSYLTLPFEDNPNYTLKDYVAEAKRKLSILPPP